MVNKLIIKEHSSKNYSPRTYYNAKSADVTLAFAIDFNTAGERLTRKASYPNYLSLDIKEDWIVNARNIYKYLVNNKSKSINIAGNGIYTLSKYGYNQIDIDNYIFNVVDKVHCYYNIQKVFTGGQTGVDLAGAKAGYRLGIDTEVTLPNGFIMRFEEGKDESFSEDFVRKLITISD